MKRLQEYKQKIGFYYSERKGDKDAEVSTGRFADIYFRKENEEWKFEGCKFNGVQDDSYTLEDWKFISQVEHQIQILLNKLNT